MVTHCHHQDSYNSFKTFLGVGIIFKTIIMFLLLTVTVSATEIDTAMNIFLTLDNDISIHRASKKWVNPSIMEDIDLQYVLEGTDDLLGYGQLYKRWKIKVIERIHVMYTESKTDKERLHWFMVMTTVTQRDNDLVDMLTEPESVNRVLSKEIIKLMTQEDSLDMLFYIDDDVAKTQLWDLIVSERQKLRTQ